MQTGVGQPLMLRKTSYFDQTCNPQNREKNAPAGRFTYMNQFRQLFSYLLNLGRVTSEGSRNNVSINRN
jgi:hypothetical protein